MRPNSCRPRRQSSAGRIRPTRAPMGRATAPARGGRPQPLYAFRILSERSYRSLQSGKRSTDEHVRPPIRVPGDEVRGVRAEDDVAAVRGAAESGEPAAAEADAHPERFWLVLNGRAAHGVTHREGPNGRST